MVQARALPRVLVKRQHILAFGLRQRPAISARRKLNERLPMARLGGAPGVLHPTEAGTVGVEEIPNRLLGHRAAGFGHLEVVRFQFPQPGLGDNLVYFELAHLRLAVFEVVPRAARAQLGELDVSADVDRGDKIHFPPHPVELRLLGVFE